MDVWSQNPWVGWSPNPSGVPVPTADPIPDLAPADALELHGPLWLTIEEQAAIAATATTWCPYRTVSPARGGCNPWKCWAHYGATCGGSHTDDAHCLRCLYPTRHP